jgi:hypothetical protein
VVETDEESRHLLAALIDSDRLGAAIKTVIDRKWEESFQSFLESVRLQK